MATNDYFVTMMVQMTGENEDTAALEVSSETIRISGTRRDMQRFVLDASTELFEQLKRLLN